MPDLRAFASSPRSRLWAEVIALFAICVAWTAVARGPLAIGPSEWDDHLYCDLAVTPSESRELVFRYAHIWGLRLAFLVVGHGAFAGYSLVVVLLLCLGVHFLGRRLAGPLAGLACAALVPAFPAIYYYLDAPYTDVTMAAWSVFALSAAVLAHSARELGRHRTVMLWTLVSGVACLLALKSKEVGAAVTPAVAYLLLRDTGGEGLQRTLRRVALPWLAGVLLGLVLLAVGDAVFLGDFSYGLRPETYLSRTSAVSHFVPSSVRLEATGKASDDGISDADFVSLLLTAPFFPWTLLAAFAFYTSFRREPIARALATWTFFALLVSSLVAAGFTGIHALPRYLVVPGVPMCVLGGAYLARAWNERDRVVSPSRRAFAVLLAVTFVGLWLSGFLGKARAEHFLLPLVSVVALVASASADTWARRVALAVLAGTVVWTSLNAGRWVHGTRLYKVRAWDEVVLVVDAERKRHPERPVVVGLSGLKKPYTNDRVRRRLNARHAGVARYVEVRAGTDHAFLVLASPAKANALMQKGWQVVARGGEAPPRRRVTPNGKRREAESPFVALVRR